MLPVRWLIGAVLLCALATCAFMRHEQMTLDPYSGADLLAILLFAGGLVARVIVTGKRSRPASMLRDGIDHVLLFAAVCVIGAVASYPVAAATTGFDDPTLANVDRTLRFDWVGLYALVASHPLLQVVERIAYESIFVSPAVLLGYFAVTGRRAEARLFIASFLLAAVLTLILFSAAPARGPLAYLWHGPIPYMPESALYQAQLIPSLRTPGPHDLTLSSLHGIVCAPSFHAASAVLYIVAAWGVPRLRWPLLALNVAMLLATPIEGTHYLADILGGMAVAALSSAIIRTWLVGALRRSEPPPAFARQRG